MARKSRKAAVMDNGEEERKEAPSRSAKKRESAALQKMGENLIKLKADARASLPLSADLLEALAFYDTLTDREAARRQRQYIGKLMRDVDAAAIMAALEKLESPHAHQMARFHNAERWREKLLAVQPDESSVDAFFKDNDLQPDMRERKDLLSLCQRAYQAGGSDPALKRNLFRQILSLLEKGS